MKLEPITAVILAGGRARRMGEVDKGLEMLRGRSLVEWVLERIEPQVDDVFINANRNLDRYLEYGYPVISDRIPDYAGPLAELHAALTEVAAGLVLTVPCDAPFVPADLVQRLRQALQEHDAQIAVASTAERVHPVFSLCRSDVLTALAEYLNEGGRKVEAWHATLRCASVVFTDEDAFRNLNTLEELEAVARTLT